MAPTDPPTWDDEAEVNQLTRVAGVWLLRRCDDHSDEYETLPLSDLQAVRWLLRHRHGLPDATTWDGDRGDALHRSMGRWFLSVEEQTSLNTNSWETLVRELSYEEAVAWLVHNRHPIPAPSETVTVAEPPATPEPVVYRFQQRADRWEIQFGSAETYHLPDRVGMHHIARLLQDRGQRVGADRLQNRLLVIRGGRPTAHYDPNRTELTEEAGLQPRASSRGKKSVRKDEAQIMFQSDQPKADYQAISEALDRLADLRNEIESADANNDHARKAAAEKEKVRIEDDLRDTKGGLGRTIRKFKMAKDAARQAVYQALKRVYRLMEEKKGPLPALARHLRDHIKPMGYAYAYLPPSDFPDWTL
jgi:hypothetical protein